MAKFYRQSWAACIGMILVYIFSANAAVPVPRPEHPKPQFKREAWQNLNGEWNFALDFDEVHSYAGLRKFHIKDNRLFLNNEPFYLRFVLDQGFYPDGIWTAPGDSDLRLDIERALAVGFSGARLHQKVFEERFHYWADKLGYLTAGEFYDKGMDFGHPQAVHNHQREWREAVMRDFNHPSILFWTPFNETSKEARKHPEAHRHAVQSTVDLTRHLDPTRPVHDASGFAHVDTDIYFSHTYQQHPDTLRKDYHSLRCGRYEGVQTRDQYSVPYQGQPFIVAEIQP